MSRNGSRYDDSNSAKTPTQPTFSEVLGNGQYTNRDHTGNQEYPPNLVPTRTHSPGRGDPGDSLDRFSPTMAGMEYDFTEMDDSDSALPLEQTDPNDEANSQRDLEGDCPSMLDPCRFVHQNRAGHRTGRQ